MNISRTILFLFLVGPGTALSNDFPAQTGCNCGSGVIAANALPLSMRHGAPLYAPVRANLERWRALKLDYEQEKHQLLNQRVLGGLGPTVQSVDALHVAEVAHGIGLAANLVSRAASIFVPGSRIFEVKTYETLEGDGDPPGRGRRQPSRVDTQVLRLISTQSQISHSG